MRRRRRAKTFDHSQNCALDLQLLHASDFLGHGCLERVNHARGRLNAKFGVSALELESECRRKTI